MSPLNEWRPGSFTKNFSWGLPAEGLRQLHETIRLGFNDEMKDVPRALFRERVSRIRRPDYIPINFFLFNKIVNGQDLVVADELVFQALSFDHSLDFDRLGLFAFIFSYVGTWKGAEEYQSRPALWAHHYVIDRVANEFGWNSDKVSADDIEKFVESDKRYRAQTARKLATNLNYLFQIGGLRYFNQARIERWWVNALFLALDRLIEDRLLHGETSASHQWASQLDRANFHFVSGRRSVEKDLATKHLLKLYEACGARTRFSEDEVRERQKLLLPDIQWFTNQESPIAALQPTNPRIIKTIPRACAMLARYVAGFITFDLDELEHLDLDKFIRDQTREALHKLRDEGISPTMSAEDLIKLTRGR
jgi:hypothetical protein